MGQHKGTAFACRDWSLAKSDLLDDLMEGWDSYADMANGASDVDRSNARDALNELSQEWDGTIVPDDDLDAFADEYDAALRSASKRAKRD